ncbi:MAG: TetR/AcrR family transcriptional regulator [Rhodococcus sp. (in: high G+C Gram-positive bacteria)]
MTTMSASAERICAVAVSHFAEHGYDGSSLNTIATAAGMRKPSLYAHFASKDALFLAAFFAACAAERDFIATCFGNADEDAAPGEVFVMALEQRYRTSEQLRMLLRCAYVPPAAHRDRIVDEFVGIHRAIGDEFDEQVRNGKARHAQLSTNRIGDLTEMYLGVVDSLHVELMYGTARSFERRRDAMWSMFRGTLVTAAVTP